MSETLYHNALAAPPTGEQILLSSAPNLLDPNLARQIATQACRWRNRRFVVASQPLEARVMNGASRLVSVSGVLAHLAAPVAHIVYHGAIAVDAQRRMTVMASLAASSNLEMLQAGMRVERIAHDVVVPSHPVAIKPI